MTDATPKAEELAKDKGVDLDSVKGTGKDGRVLVEDVEALVDDEGSDEEAPAGGEKHPTEVVGQVGEHDLVATPAESVEDVPSVDAYELHPHVPLAEQTDAERAELEEGLANAEAQEASEPEEPGEAVAKAAEEGESDEPDPSLLLSTDAINSRGERERGFYTIPEQTNPNAPHPNAVPEEVSAEDEDVKETVRPAQQEGVVDTSSGDSPSHGQSLKDKAPAVADVAEQGGAGTYDGSTKE